MPSLQSPPGRAPWRILPENPFVGLRPYESEESLLFFGRGTQTLELMDRLHDSRFVAVVGSSGCGKSSLVRAGLIPNLQAGFLANGLDRWKIAGMKPGETPLYSLAAALTADAVERRSAAEALVARIREGGLTAVLDHIRTADEPRNFLLMVDQFEEVFRSIKREATAQQIDDATDFVSLLLGLTGQKEVPVYVVISMRTDFLGDCDAFFGLPEALNRSQYLVPRLTRQQRREVIEGPIFLYRKEIKPELVDRVLNDAGERSDQLPVLQHALMRTWHEFIKQGEGEGEVELIHYQACGGMARALNRHAEQAMEGMTAKQERLTERVFRALSDTDDHGRRIRRPQRLSELAAITGGSAKEVLDVVERLQSDQRSFLILAETETPGDQRIDISHEALFRQWQRLEGWVEAEAQSKEDYVHLAHSARMHQKGREGLLRDPALSAAEEWRAREAPTEAWGARYGGNFHLTMDYLDASLRVLAAEQASRRQRRRVWVKGAIVAVGGLLLYLWVQAHTARNERARLLSALATMDPLVRALVGAEVGGSAASELLITLQQVAAAAIPLAVLGDRELQAQKEKLAGAWFEPGGKQVSTVSVSGVLKLWPADGQGTPAKSTLRNATNLSMMAVSRDRQWIAGIEDGAGWTVRRDGSSSRDIAAAGTKITALAFSPDAGQILAGYADNTVRIWKRDGALVRVLVEKEKENQNAITTAQFDPSGKRALSASEDNTATVWDLDTGASLAVLRNEKPVARAAFSPDGKLVFCGHTNGLGLIWKSEGKGIPTRLAGGDKAVTSAAFSPDGSKVAAGYADGSARIWSLQVNNSGDGGLAEISIPIVIGLPTVLSGHAGGVREVAFSEDGSQIVTASDDGTARVWWSESQEPRILGKHGSRVQSVAFSRDGNRVVSSSDDKTARIWNVADHTAGPVYKADSYVRSVAFSPDGTKVAAGSEDGVFCIWNPTGSRNVRQEANDVLSVAYSPDGTRIVTGGRDTSFRIWSVETPSGEDRPLFVAAGHKDWVWRASFSRDGSRIVSASQDKTARVWTMDRATAKLTFYVTLEHPDGVRNATFSPDGSRVATASSDRRARIWNLNATISKEFLHSDEVWGVEFSSDGKWLLTASADTTVKIWGIEDGAPHLVFSHGSGVRAAAFRPPGNSHVVTGAEDGYVRLWRVTAPDLVDYLSKASTACLTTMERMQFLRESDAAARSRYRACEVRHQRTTH